MLSQGVPLKVVSETLGHSSIAITADVYQHVTPDLRREAAEAMDRALK
jgi:integrase